MQLVHHASETSWEFHGFVRVKSDDGQLISEIPHYQHTRSVESGKSRDDTRLILSEVLAKHSSVRQPSAGLAGKATPGSIAVTQNRSEALKLLLELSANPDQTLSHKQLNRRQRMTPMPRQYEPCQGNVSMRQTPSRRPASLVRSGSSVSALADNGQQVLQCRRRSNSTTR